jgi:hypothetical protein
MADTEIELVEREIQNLEAELVHIEELVDQYRENLRHLQNRAAKEGGEEYIIAGLRRIVDYSERDGRSVIYELAFPLLEEVIERVKQPLRTAT